ncbi:hypothetical protein Pcinc_025886 [Petrolisthes cinctipes]|uniref:Uncharacterized protein n=1 Tax=Petrolisthes cinctipes TaxID=88211 RepID=A0AAE1KCE2_PETCI|nr:hypothetical protein Pcinc_025886 [Petrolisthes cinctipes]
MSSGQWSSSHGGQCENIGQKNIRFSFSLLLSVIAGFEGRGLRVLYLLLFTPRLPTHYDPPPLHHHPHHPHPNSHPHSYSNHPTPTSRPHPNSHPHSYPTTPLKPPTPPPYPTHTLIQPPHSNPHHPTPTPHPHPIPPTLLPPPTPPTLTLPPPLQLQPHQHQKPKCARFEAIQECLGPE